MRLDPSPRLNVLIEAGVVTADHPAVMALRITFERRLVNAQESMAGSS
jgi:hypothetical protein